MHTTLTIKTDRRLRDEAKKTAAELGVPLTTIMNAMLKQFVREKEISLSVHPMPKPEKIELWDRVSDEADAGRGISGPFRTFKELKQHMDGIRSRARRTGRNR